MARPVIKILLINPPSRGIYQRLGFILPPLGLGYLAAVLERDGHAVEIWDADQRRKPSLPLANYRLVGVSCDTGKADQALAIMSQAKRAGVTVVAGGPHPAFVPHESFAAGADYVVHGEGEDVLRDLAAALAAGQPEPVIIPGLSAKSGDGTVHGGHRAPPRLLDDLPFPARHLLDMNHYTKLELRRRKITPIITSRGCPFRCEFCASSAFSGTNWRVRSAHSVADEVQLVVKQYGFKAVAFTDDAFMLNTKRVAAIAEGLLARNLDVLWWCFARADTVLAHPELLPLIHRSGARTVFIGIECGSQAGLDELSKGTSVEHAREAVALLRRHGIDTLASFILGVPGETRHSVNATIRFARKLRPTTAQFSLLTPYPGTALHARLQQRIWSKDWRMYDCLHPTFHLDHLSPRQLTRALHKAYRVFYLTPGRIAAGFLSGFRGKGIKVHKVWKHLRNIGGDPGTTADVTYD